MTAIANMTLDGSGEPATEAVSKGRGRAVGHGCRGRAVGHGYGCKGRGRAVGHGYGYVQRPMYERILLLALLAALHYSQPCTTRSPALLAALHRSLFLIL